MAALTLACFSDNISLKMNNEDSKDKPPHSSSCLEKWDLAHNGLPSDIKDCFVRLKRLTQTEIKMLARSSRKRTSDSDFISGPAKRKFKRIVLPNDNSEDEDGATSTPANGSSSQRVEVPRISIDEARSLSSRKSETDGENVTEAVKKLSQSSGRSQESKNNLARRRKFSDRKSEVEGENATEAVKKSDLSHSSGGSLELKNNSSETRSFSDRKSEVDGENVTEAVKKSDLSHSSGGSLELKNNSSGMRSFSDRKSEVDGEIVTEAVKKSDLNHSSGGSQGSKNNTAGMISKEVTNCLIKDTKIHMKKQPGKILGKKQKPTNKNPKLLKEDVVKNSATPERNPEEKSNDVKNSLGAEKKRLLAINIEQNKAESVVSAPQSAKCDKGHNNHELTTQMSSGKFGDVNLSNKINTHEGFNHLKGEKRSLQNKDSTSKDNECEVERVLAQIFHSPSKTSNEKRFFNSDEKASISPNDKVALNYENKSSKEISQPASKNSDSSKSCNKQHDVPKDLTKSSHGIKKNGIDSHPSAELKEKHSKPVSGVNNDSSNLIASKNMIGTTLSNSIKESFSSLCSRNDEPKKNSYNPTVSAGVRSEKIQRSKSMGDNVTDSRVQQTLSIDSEKHANNGKSPSSVKKLLFSHNNETKKLIGKPGTPNCRINKIDEKVSKVVGDDRVAGNGTSHATLRQLDRNMKSIKRSVSVGNAPVNSAGESKTIHLVQNPKSSVSQPRSPPHPVKSKFKKVDGDWMVSTVCKSAQSLKTGNAVEIGSEFPENREKLHFFSKETVSAGNLSKVIEKCRQKVGAYIQTKEKSSSGFLLDSNNKHTLDQVVRTPLKTSKPSICGNSELSKETDGTHLVQSNPEQIKAASTAKRVSKCQKLPKDVKTGSLRKSVQEKDEICDSSVRSNEKSPSPLPGIVAENIDELMREYEQLTNRAAAAKTSTKKKIERRPSQKKLLTMFGEEHFIEDCQSILQHPLTGKEKAFPGKQILSNGVDMDGVNHASLADKEPELKSLSAGSERELINEKALSYSKLKAGKKRNLSESFQRKKHFEKVRRNSSGALSEGVKISDRELTAIQSNLLEKSKSFIQKQCLVVSTKKVSPNDSINNLDSNGEKSKTVTKKPRKSTERRISTEKCCTGEEDDSIAKRSHISDAELRINQFQELQEIKSSGKSVDEDSLSKCLNVENVCKTQKNESISVVGGISGAYEANPKDPKLRENLNDRPKEKESVGGKEKEDSAEIIEAADGIAMSQVPSVSSDCNNLGSPACENSSSTLCPSTTVEYDKEIAIDSAQTPLLKDLLTRKTIDGRNESSLDEEAKVCYAKKLEDINSSLSLSLGLLSDIPVQPLSAVQESLENPVNDGQGKTDVNEYVKKLEQQHEMLEKVVGEAMAKKCLIWKQLQSYHGIIEVKKEVPDDSSDDDCQVIFSAGDVSWIKEDSNSTAETEVLDWLNDSAQAQKDVSNESQDPELSLCEISESENLNPGLETSEHSVRRHCSSSVSTTDECRTGSNELNEKDLRQSTFKIENSGYAEGMNEKHTKKNVDESTTDARITEPDGFISGVNVVAADLTRNIMPSSTSGQSKDLEVENIPAIPSNSQLLTSPEELPVSQSNTVIVFCNSSVNRPLLCSPNKPHSTQTINVLDKSGTTSDSDRGIILSLQSINRDSAIEPNGSNLTGNLMNSGKELEDLNSSRNTVTSVNSTKNTETLVPNNMLSVREKRIRVRGMEDLMEKPATGNSETAVECQTGNDNYLKECFISEDGVVWFNYLVFYMLKIAQRVEEFMEKSPSSEISEVEDAYKENCVIIYDLFKKSIARYKADPNSFITILFMKMVTQWKNFKGLLTLDSLKTVIKKCLAKCLELMSPGKRDKFVSEANELLAKLRIFPPLVLVNQAAVSKRPGISERAVIRSNPEANEMVQSSYSTTVSFPNAQQQSSIVTNNHQNYSHGGNNPVRYLESSTSQVQQAQRPPLNNQVQMNPNVVNNRNAFGQSIGQLSARHNDSARASMLINASPNDGQPPSELITQRNVVLANMNLPASKNISSLQHVNALTRNLQTRGIANPGSCSVMNGKTYILPKSSANVPLPNIQQASGRNNLQSLGSSNLSQQKNAPPSYSPSSSNISSRVYQPMMGRSVFNSASNSVQGSGTHVLNGRAGFYPKTTVQEAHQMTLQNTAYGTSGTTLSNPPSSNKPKNPNNALSSSGRNVTLPQILPTMRPSLLGNYYGANVSSSSNGALRSSQTSMTASGGVSNSTAQQFTSNHLNATQMLLAQGSSMPPVSSLSVPGRHTNSSGLGQPVSLPLAINPLTRQPIQAQHHPQEQVSENNHFPGVNGYQISCQVTVNPSYPYNPNNSRASLSTRDSSELVRTAGRNSTGFSGTSPSQHINVNHGIFQNQERNQQIPHRHSLSTTGTLAAQSYPEHQLLSSNTHSASRQNPQCSNNSGNILSATGSDNRRYALENHYFQQSGTDVAVVGNSYGQSQIAAKNFSTVHTYQQLNRPEASPNNSLLSQIHSSNLQPNTRGDPSSYPYSMSLMKQAEARSNMQLSLPGPVHSTPPGIFPEDSDQGRGQGTNRSVSRDSGYRSPSQLTHAMFVEKKQETHVVDVNLCSTVNMSVRWETGRGTGGNADLQTKKSPYFRKCSFDYLYLIMFVVFYLKRAC
ncbi:hypothetical protein J437_LFUL008672 [Ladona fulva]|uniref:Uncharacterized protein n=1 Tax=Ladona fulva TaxID=123851 RepID=A0A8K0K691_LADFU|nr:hypothetical protein J437_LFUL008672 [Ladona fulva]